MFICIVSRGLPSTKEPLSGIFELDQAEALKRLGHNVVFFILDFRSIFKIRRIGCYVNRYNNFQTYTISIPIGNIELPICQFLIKKFICLFVRDFKKKIGNPDLLHSHFLPITNLASEIKKQLGIPLVSTEHSSLLNVDKLTENIYRLGTSAYKNVDFLISVSNAMKNQIQKHFNINSLVIPNIVNLKEFQGLSKLNNSINRSSNFVFVSVGSLTRNKGFDLLIKSFKLADFPENVYLNIIGDGELKEELIESSIQLGVQKNVKLLGYKPRSDIYNYFSNANAFVLASRSETFGVVYIEALIHGLPIIATKCGGPEDIVNSDNGIAVEINDEIALSHALVYLYNNSKNYNSQLISNNALLRYAPTNVAIELTNVYKNLLDIYKKDK